MNHMYRAMVKNRFSNCDQLNVSKLVNKWLRESPQDKIYFRPYANAEEPNLHNDSDDDDEWDTDDEDDEQEVKITKKWSWQTMLFVHQTNWQSRLLRRYGEMNRKSRSPRNSPGKRCCLSTRRTGRVDCCAGMER